MLRKALVVPIRKLLAKWNGHESDACRLRADTEHKWNSYGFARDGKYRVDRIAHTAQTGYRSTFPERYLFLNSERPGDKIYALIARAIATPESSDEFEAVITELRAALKEHIHRIRTKAVSYLPPSDSDL